MKNMRGLGKKEKMHMTIRMLTFLIILLVIMLLTGCSQAKSPSNALKSKPFLGVIETTGQHNKSKITFYSKTLVQQDTLELPFGSMGSYFDLPKVHDGYLYVVPRGIASIKDLTIILEVDLSDGKHKTYDMKQPQINSFCVDEDYVYSANTRNHQSLISQVSKADKVLRTLDMGKVFIGKIDCYQDKLCAFGFGDDAKGEMQSYLYIIDPIKLILEKTVDLTEEGQDQLGSLTVEDYLYFTNALKYDQTRGEIPSTTLSQFHMKEHRMTSIPLLSTYPFQILEHQDKLYISHYNLVQGEGSQLSIYDPILNTTEIYDFRHQLAQIAIHEETLYTIDGKKMYTYNIGDNSFKKVHEKEIYTMKDEKEYYYVSGFFMMP
ncbi:hypothetical protein HZI73_09690 [Vallitalea pronyensis]|uniref:Lipoprotein n=1 Tax=Vallitalea pronyensis TaxID=1348613 RepID=A0A8J8SGA4_9FIRM|nr:hypothetical protein [Vallitalea pronyensis]QUI22555.1 hypothetical protein HZI73_09690 [Vallitalea pronyensis]